MAAEASYRDRAAALCLLLAVIGLGYGLGLHGWWTAPLLETRRELTALREQELQLRMLAGQRAALQARLAEVRAREAADAAFLAESDAALASAGLVRRLEAVVAQAPAGGAGPRCTIGHRTPKTVSSDEPFQRIVLQARLRCPMGALAQLVSTLESGQPRLFLARLSIHRPPSHALHGEQEATEPVLDVGFELYGYLHRAPAPAGSSDEA